MKLLTLVSAVALSILTGCNGSSSSATTETKASLGEKLFNDTELSRDGTQACATCHEADHAFIDPRINVTSVDANTPGAVSLGQDDQALGDINTPTAAYASFIPDFHFDEDEGLFIGGNFLNGRSVDIQDQARHPFLNPVEMMNADEAAVVDKVLAKYEAEMKALYGDDVFDSTEKAYSAITESIAAFERTDEFAPFDSKFDRVLKGEAEFTAEEQQGFAVFVAEGKGNCAACHPVPGVLTPQQDSLFTDFSYDNLGVPVNEVVRNANGLGLAHVDDGLLGNPAVTDTDLRGAFRVTGLRNIAVTAPYMHNGVFKDLKTVVHFYNTRDVAGAINPETNLPWRTAEVDTTKNDEELGDLGLSDAEEDAIVAFLKTLTDQRYEHLIPTD